TVWVYDVKTGKKLGDVVPNVKSPLGGSLVWKGDNSGFYYTRNPPIGRAPKAGELTQQLIYFHTLGKDVGTDTYVFGKEQPPHADSVLDMSPDDKYLLASVSTGWTSEDFAHYLITANGNVTKIGAREDKLMTVRFGADNDLYMLSYQGAPRGKIIRVPAAKPLIKDAKTVVPQQAGAIQGFLVLEKRLLVQEFTRGHTRLRAFDFAGKELPQVPIPEGFHINELVTLDGDEILVQLESYFTPLVWYHYSPKGRQLRKTKLVSDYPKVDFSPYEVANDF